MKKLVAVSSVNMTVEEFVHIIMAFPLLFLWYAYFPNGIPMVCLLSQWYSYGMPALPMVFLWCSCFSNCYSYGVPVLPNGIPMVKDIKEYTRLFSVERKEQCIGPPVPSLTTSAVHGSGGPFPHDRALMRAACQWAPNA